MRGACSDGTSAFASSRRELLTFLIAWKTSLAEVKPPETVRRTEPKFGIDAASTIDERSRRAGGTEKNDGVSVSAGSSDSARVINFIAV